MAVMVKSLLRGWKTCETALSKGEITAKLALFVDICGHHPKSKLVVGEATSKELAQAYKACIDDMSWELRVAWDRCILKCTSVLQPMFLRLHSLCMLITSNYPADICRLEWTLQRLKAAGTRWALDNWRIWRIWRNLRRFGSDLCVRCFHRSHENFKLSQTEGLYPMHLAVYWPPSPFHRTIWLNHPEAIRAGTAFRARNIRNWNGKLVAFRQLTR